MHVPPIVPVKPSEHPAAPAAGIGATRGGNEFAAMIAPAEDDGAAEIAAGAMVENLAPDATGAVASDGATPVEAVAGGVIRRMIDEANPQSAGSAPAVPEARLDFDIDAVPTAAVTNGGETLQPGSAVQQSPALAAAPATKAGPVPPVKAAPTDKTGAVVKAAKPEAAAASPTIPVALDGALADLAEAPQAQTAGPVPRAGTNPAPIEFAQAGEAPAPATKLDFVIGAPAETIQIGAPRLASAASPVEAAPTAIDFDPLAARPRATGADGAGKGNGAGPSDATATGGNPTSTSAAPAAELTGLARGPTIAPDPAGRTPITDAAPRSADAALDGAAKRAPAPSAAGAQPTAPQMVPANDTAAAFGSDLRLGADGTRPAGLDHVFRSPTLQPAAEQVAVQINRAAQQGADRITVNLKPASLGNISVDLEIGPDNRLIAVISADRPETLDLMQRDARALERALNDAGLKADSGSLSFNLRGDGGDHGTEGRTDGSADWSSFAAPGDAVEATPVPVYARTLPGGGIDIRV